MRWPIRNKLLVGMILLGVIVATLSWSGFHGIYAYRNLVKSLSRRLGELPLASQLAQAVSDLRASLPATDPAWDSPEEGEAIYDPELRAAVSAAREEFNARRARVAESIATYRQYLAANQIDNTPINDSRAENATVLQIEKLLQQVQKTSLDYLWLIDPERREQVDQSLEEMQRLAGDLPRSLYDDFQAFTEDARVQYRALIGLGWTTFTLMVALLGLLFLLFYRWIFAPLRVLIAGSRQVAQGNFNYQIRLATQDEMSELADAMNAMTGRFRAIRDDLDHQVQERTKQVVRSERLASVGFLAAGVAHEINNPLASIALCAESLDGRLVEALPEGHPQRAIATQYLRMIQDEAFRCKGITEKLLDFSRMGDVQRQPVELRGLIASVIEMVGHLGKYHDKRVELAPGEPVWAQANPQEIKQVVLNIIANGLDSLDAGGVVRVALAARHESAEIVFQDNGCGMSDEVLEHLFEPFFTRRRAGQGTGLGLSITYRIVQDHGGSIEATSAGPGQGSEFRVRLPLAAAIEERRHQHQAA